MQTYLDVLRKYAVFTGRASRKEYWMFFLVNLIIYLIILALQSMTKGTGLSVVLSLIYVLYALGILIPNLAVSVRRLHDTNHSGWWLFIGLIPLIGAIILLVWMIGDSTPGANEYGPNPKEGMAPPSISGVVA